uniref:Innate immunity activator a n=1 Tax=Lepisosteus oculatus TaxID=7918 RepID=W5MVX9_LEPOC
VKRPEDTESKMESKDETSDTDSGIILQSGPDSPSTPMKDLSTHTRAVKLRHKSLEDRLELCLLELKKLCIREAELTGQLSKDYPLLPGEKPPQIRRRIGAAFRLNAESILPRGEDPVLSSLEAELALQLQIYEAARRLSLEEHHSKPVKRSRQQQYKREERKVKELQEAVYQRRLRLVHGSPRPGLAAGHKDVAASDDSSLSDSAVLDDEEAPSQSAPPTSDPVHTPASLPPPQASPLPSHRSPRRTPPQTLDGLRPGYSPSLEYERSPIQNTPWKESSLDQPYEKPRKTLSACSSQSSSPAVTPVSTPVDPRLGEAALPFHFVPVKTLALRHVHSNSAPSTPELPGRRQHSQSFRVPTNDVPQDPNQMRGRARLPARRLTSFTVPSPECSPLPMTVGKPLYQSSSEDSSSEQSVPSYASSPHREVVSEQARPCPPPYPGTSNYYVSQHNGHPTEIDMGRLYLGPPVPHHWDPREFWYEEVTPQAQRVLRPLPAHVRLSRAPSLKEHPRRASPGCALPREVVSEELKSWHERSQFRGARPRSLDRQGAVRMRSVPGRESPLSRQNTFRQQNPQRHILQRAPDGTPVQWFEEEDSEIVSQV